MSESAEHRIEKRHLERNAVVYVRQSTTSQVRSNTESTKIQIGLHERGIRLGWTDPLVIDEDLGISASGFEEREGFQRLLAMVATHQVGIILAIDASRLSRNSKDWAHLLELCGYFDTLLADLDQVYDLSLPNDRLLMGIKGTVSELELSTIKMRMRTGAEAKAARGELRWILPPGYLWGGEEGIVQDPDERVRQAIRLAFSKFERSASVRQLAMWYRDTKTLFPIRKVGKDWPVAWEVPSPKALEKFLKHPVYAGVYTYGRRETRVEFLDGRLVKRTSDCRPPEECRVFIQDHHPAYITWEQYLANRAKMTENRPRWNMSDNRGAAKRGAGLLAGILRCGHCGSRIYVGYKSNRRTALYYCDAGGVKGSKRCLSFGSKLIEQAVGGEVCRALSPIAIEAATIAQEQHQSNQSEIIENSRLQLEAARYAADRAFEQFDAVDPKNRLVAATLEERWNDKLAEVERATACLSEAQSEQKPLTVDQRQRLEELGSDFPQLWGHQHLEPAEKKRILRTAIQEIIVTHQPEKRQLDVVIHWQGGAHTRTSVYKYNREHGGKTDIELVETVRTLAETLGDAEIARILNMKKVTTPRGLPWTQDRVRYLRGNNRIPSAPKSTHGEYMTGEEATEYLGVSRNALHALIKRGVIHNDQVTEFAPWRLRKEELDSEPVRELVAALKATGRLPKGGSPKGQGLLFTEE